MAPLFLLRDGCHLTARQFHFDLKRLLQQAGYNPNCYNTHSFRIGAATSAARAGVSTKTIKAMGRWMCTAYKQYIRPVTMHSTKQLQCEDIID